jgi:hypothetical protein
MSSNTSLSPGKFASFLLIAVVAFLLLIELACWIVLEAADAKILPRHNRVLSGYSVFTTTPNFRFLTSKTDPSQTDVASDDFGFVHDTPIAMEKPEGVVRIFLNGGSALFGAGQSRVYSAAHPYPHALFSYPDSIAGQLQGYLSERRPDIRFEVINAAAYTKKMHQSMTDYLSVISRFSPDFIINMDGFNDLNAFVSGTPFADLGKDVQLYVDLQAPLRFPETTSLYQILKRIHERLFFDPFQTGLGVRIHTTPPEVDSPRSAYEGKKATYVANAQRFIENLDRYAALLRQDEVDWLFVLQPMVDRGINKELTESEAAWQRHVQSFKHDHAEYRSIMRYFFDDYLSDVLAEHVEAAGFTYIDMGRESVELGSDFQLFTDYCHLTLEGNEFVARQMGEFVLKNLSTQGDVTIRRAASKAGG